ncbi:MAG: prefoldin subunit alpha [Promethearchaeota archaeon]
MSNPTRRLSMEQLQEMATLLEYYEAQLKELESQRNLIKQELADIEVAMRSINSLSEVEDEEVETLFSLSARAKVRATIKKPKSFIIGVGARYHVEQDTEKSKKLLQSQQEAMEKTRKVIEDRMQDLITRSNQIRPVLESAIEQMRMQGQGSTAGSMPRKIDLDAIK